MRFEVLLRQAKNGDKEAHEHYQYRNGCTTGDDKCAFRKDRNAKRVLGQIKSLIRWCSLDLGKTLPSDSANRK